VIVMDMANHTAANATALRRLPTTTSYSHSSRPHSVRFARVDGAWVTEKRTTIRWR